MSSSLTGAGGYYGPAGSTAGQKMAGNIIPKGYKQAQLQQFTPEQMNLFRQMFSQVGPESFLSKLAGGDPSQFEALEAPAMRQFGQLQSQIASRYSGVDPGAMSARRGSGFQGAQTSAAQQFAESLQAQRLGLQRQALMDLMGISESLLGQRPYEQFMVKKDPSFLQQLGLGLAGSAGQMGSMFGGLGLANWAGFLGNRGQMPQNQQIT